MPLSLPELVRREYYASQPSADCVRAMLSFVEETPACDVHNAHFVKSLLKIGTKLPLCSVTADHLATLHDYAHRVAPGLRGQSKRLYAHLHRDAAVVVEKQYTLTSDIALGKEAIADYRIAAFGVDLRQEQEYALLTLTERLLVATRVGARMQERDIIDHALQDLARYPKRCAPERVVRSAHVAIDHARTTAAKIRRAA